MLAIHSYAVWWTRSERWGVPYANAWPGGALLPQHVVPMPEFEAYLRGRGHRVRGGSSLYVMNYLFRGMSAMTFEGRTATPEEFADNVTLAFLQEFFETELLSCDFVWTRGISNAFEEYLAFRDVPHLGALTELLEAVRRAGAMARENDLSR